VLAGAGYVESGSNRADRHGADVIAFGGAIGQGERACRRIESGYMGLTPGCSRGFNQRSNREVNLLPGIAPAEPTGDHSAVDVMGFPGADHKLAWGELPQNCRLKNK